MEPLTHPHIRIIETPGGNLSPRLQSIGAREALRQLLYEIYGIDRLPRIAGYANGKPYFPDHPHLHFNLSHCRSAVMAAVADRPVGCDIEDVQDEASMDMLEVAFNAAEREKIISAGNPPLELTRLWTAKEAFAKCSGNIPDNPADIPSDASTTAIAHNNQYIHAWYISPK